MTDHELIAQFESGSLPAAGFHHTDHVRMAFAYLRQYPVLEALQRFCAGLQRFAKAHGKANLYHETITWTYLLLIQERIARTGEQQSWEDFARTNPDRLTWKDSILKSFSSEETLQSDLARRIFIFPDKISSDSRP